MRSKIVWEGDTEYGHYDVVDGLYDGRPGRVLYSDGHKAAQSGVAHDNKPDLLFDYNQRLFEVTEALTPRKLLLIGGGVGTLVSALLRALPSVHIDMVEPDSGLTKLGYELFDLPVDERLHIFHTNGRAFLTGQAGRYDVILVDAFNHTTIPNDLKTAEAFKAYKNHLHPNGLLAVNVISGYYGTSARVLKQMFAAAQMVFGSVGAVLAASGYSLWLPQNFILTAHSDPYLAPANYMRAKPVEPPPTHPSDVLHDT